MRNLQAMMQGAIQNSINATGIPVGIYYLLMTETFINIADITIGIRSAQQPEKETTQRFRYRCFVCHARPRRVDIELDLQVVRSYKFFKSRSLFRTERDLLPRKELHLTTLSRPEKQYLGSGLDWRIGAVGKKYLIEGGTSGRYQLLINNALNKGDVFIVNPKGEWKASDVVFGFLQVLIIFYLAKHRQGLLFHASGLADKNKGFLFSGLSRAGKSTTSRIWDKTPGVRILNDDRIILRRKGDVYYMYPTPWHGDYSEYLKRGLAHRAKLSKLFYIYHRDANFAEKMRPVDGFNHFIKTLFLPFWDKKCLKFSFDYLQDLLTRKPCYKFGFKNDTGVIPYVRSLR